MLGQDGFCQVALATDIPYPLQNITEDRLVVVYGSPFQIKEKADWPAWHMAVNGFITWLRNLVPRLRFTYVETIY